MNNFISMEQIRINAVLGVCERQRELIAENRKLRTQAKFNDEIGGIFGFGLAIAVMLFCILA
jgi:hypothetical protein